MIEQTFTLFAHSKCLSLLNLAASYLVVLGHTLGMLGVVHAEVAPQTVETQHSADTVAGVDVQRLLPALS